MSDDASLLLSYVSEHSEPAFAALVARHVDLVYSAALRLARGDTHRAQDVTQSVFTTLARKAPALTGHPALGGWLYNTTQHFARSAVRDEMRRRTRETEAWHMNRHEEPHAAAWEGLRPVLDDAMRDLGDREREAVVLRFFSKQPFSELGRSLGVSEDAARMRVDRALDRLRRALASRGITSTAAALSLLLTAQSVSAAPAGLASAVTGTALTSATTASTTTTLLSFMSTTKFTVAATAALLAALGAAYHQHRQHAAAQETLTATRAAQARQLAALHVEEDRAKTAEHELARLDSALAALRSSAVARARTLAAAAPSATASAASPTTAPVTPPLTPDEEGAAFAARHPEVKRALSAYGSASQRFRYAPMYRALNLTPDQIRLWESLASGSMGAGFPDGRGMSLPVGERVGSDERSRLTEEALGSDGRARLKEFTALGYARVVASDVAGSLYFTDTPLAPEQSDFLVQLLVQNKNSGTSARVSEYNWDAIVTQASGQLSAPQLAVLSAKRAGDQFRQFLNRPRSDSTSATPGK